MPTRGRSEDWIVRRTRIGFEAKVFQEFTIHSEVDLDLQNPDPLYNKLTDAYIKWIALQEIQPDRRQAGREVHAGWRHVVDGAHHD